MKKRQTLNTACRVMRRSALALALAALGLSQPAAAENLILNGEFETGNQTPTVNLTTTPGELGNWTVLNATYVSWGSQSWFGAIGGPTTGSDGSGIGNALLMQDSGSISQTISGVVAGSYIFSFDAWRRNSGTYTSWTVSGPGGSISGDTQGVTQDGAWHALGGNVVTFTSAGDVTVTFTAHSGTDGGGIDQVALVEGGLTPPPAPASLVAFAVNAQVALSWTASSGATGYTVKRSTTSGVPYPDEFAATGTSCVDSNLVNGITYYYVVSASNSAGPGANSSEVSATPVESANLIRNGEFELGTATPPTALGNGDTRVPWWTVNASDFLLASQGWPPGASSTGSDSMGTGNYMLGQTGGNLTQTISGVAAGNYIFSFDAWRRNVAAYVSWEVSGPGGSISGDTQSVPQDGAWHALGSNVVTFASAGDVTVTFTAHPGQDGGGIDQVALVRIPPKGTLIMIF